MSAPARRELVRQMVDKGLSEGRSLAVVGLSASAYRYTTQPDQDARIYGASQRSLAGASQVARSPLLFGSTS